MKIVCTVLGASAVLAGSASANLLSNGSFELGAEIPSISGYLTLPQGNPGIDGWSITHGSVDLVASSLWQAADGQVSIDLAGLAQGGIQQTFATEAGRDYRVEFDLSGNFGGEPVIKMMQATVAGETREFTFDSSNSSASDMGWERHSFVFRALNNTSTLRFEDGLHQLWGAVIDNASVTLVPAPAATAAMLFAAPVAFRRRRSTR